MINFSAEIKPSVSIGNINLGDSLDKALAQIYSDKYRVKKNNFSEQLTEYSINKGELSFVSNNHSNKIIMVACGKGYEGKWNDTFRIGMTLEEIINSSSQQMILHGYIIVDAEFGICFSLPNEFEEFDSVNELPTDLIFNRILIKEKEWWR